jgi:argininosuccinate lyase
MSSILVDSLLVADGIIKTFNINKKRMYDVSSESYAISLDIAEQLIKKKKISFRASHKLVGGLVDHAVKKDHIPLNLLTLDDISQVLVNTNFLNYDITPNDLYVLIKDITPENSINYRITKGSPNKKEQLEMILYLKLKMGEYHKKNKLRMDSLTGRIKELGFTIEKYMNNTS